MSTRYIVFKPTEIENSLRGNGTNKQKQSFIRFDGDFSGTKWVVSSITIDDQILSSYLNTESNPDTPYVPQYPGSPATKKYVDDSIPTKVSDLTNDSGFQTATQVNQAISAAVSSAYKYKGSVANQAALPASGNTTGDVWNTEDTGMNYAWTGSAWDALGTIVDLSGKQDKLIAGSNIQIASDGKTISATDTKYTAGTGINIDSNNEISANTTVLATKTDLNSKQDTISDLAAIRSGSGLGATAVQPGDNISDLNNDSGFITNSYHDNTKQDTLVSGTNIKTINGNGLLGSGNISIGEAHIMTQSEFDNVGSPKGIYFIYDYLYPTLYITITPNTYQAQVGDTIRFDITRGSNEAIGASTMTSSDGLNSWSSASFDGFTPYITGLTYTIKSEDATAGKYVLTLIATETNNPSNTIEVSCVIQVNA